jgi:PAS domain S-box-containing protein
MTTPLWSTERSHSSDESNLPPPLKSTAGAAPVDRRLEKARQVSRIAGAIALAGGIGALVGWAFDIAGLKAVIAGGSSMKANTAMAFALAGTCLVLPDAGTRFRRLANALALCVALIGLLTAGEYVLGWNIGIDQVLFRDTGPANGYAPGRMAITTALSFLAWGAAVPFAGRPRGAGVAQALTAGAALVAAIAIIGHAYDVYSLYGLASYGSMALHTAVLLLVLAVGALLAHPDVGWTALLFSDGLAGSTARQLLPAAVVVPIAVGWLRLQMQRAGLYGTPLGLGLVVISTVLTVVILMVAILRTASSLGRMDGEIRHLNETLEGRVLEKTGQLSRSEAKFRALLEAAPDAMVIVDDRGRILLINAQTEKLFGYTREQLLGERVELLMPTRFRASHPGHRETYFAAPRAGDMSAGLELFGLRRDGTEFPMEISLSPLQTEDGILVTSAIRDITERKGLEWRMQEASRLKSEFLANMSHELRTPLNAIVGFTNLLHKGKAGPVTADQQEYLGDVLTSSMHLLQLINDVLDLAKIESGTMEFRPEPVDLGRLVGEVRDVLRGLAASKHLAMSIDVDSDVATAVVDPARVKQILYNYLSNAIKFTPPGGTIAIHVLPEGPDLFRLDVSDTGVGISESDLKRLFVEFQQLDTGAGKQYQGTGLGLALVKRVAEMHGGRVAVTSTPGHGSTFSAILPRSFSTPADVAATAALESST